jgi:hypothetical protein
MRATTLLLALALSGNPIVAANAAKPVSGNADMVTATGAWAESHEGVSLLCIHMTTPKAIAKGDSVSTCFLTEAEAEHGSKVATNFFAIEKWDQHGLIATTGFTVNKNGDEVPESSPDAIKFVIRIVVDLDKGTLTKNLAGPKATKGYHLQ